MEVDKVANMMVKIPNEDFTDVTLAIGDIYGDDVKYSENCQTSGNRQRSENCQRNEKE